MKLTALIMAGGRGERFWPKSRKNMPKQFLVLTDDGKTMIQLTVERILPLVNIDDIYIVTNRDYKKLVKNQLPDLPEQNILCEPEGKNTAPCIGLGAVHIANKYEDAVMMVLPADHLIKYNKMFIDVLKDSIQIAEEKNNLVTIGITPSYPETGYGYIKFNTNRCENIGYSVDKFVEKPNFETAKEYLATGEYLWNSGMFIWKVSSILNNMRVIMPDMYEGLMNIKETIGTERENRSLVEEYSKFESQSIDCGIMEKADNIYILPGTFGWDDVGSWNAISRIRKTDEKGNVINGNIISIDTKNCIIEGGNKLIAAIGLDNLIIVDAEDALLLCDKDSTNGIKELLENIKINRRNEYL